VERRCEPMNKNRIEGTAKQGERACDRKALVIKAKRCKSGGCAAKECESYLRKPRLVPERATAMPERGGSRGRSSRVAEPTRPPARGEGPNESK